MRLPALAFALPFLLLLAPADPGAAQAGSSQEGTVKPATPRVWVQGRDGRLSPGHLVSRACPVSLDVRHGAGFSRYVATGESVREPDTQALDVTISNRGLADIASLDVIVQMRSGKAGTMPLVLEDDSQGERLRLHFDLTVKVADDLQASWSVPGLQTVAYLEPSHVTYRDGSTWSAANESACRFEVNPMMLVSAR